MNRIPLFLLGLLVFGCGGSSTNDFDGDGFPDSVDCAPADPSIFAGADEVCDDSIDNDCDGWIDCADADCLVLPTCDAGDDDDTVGDDDDDSAGDDDDSVGDDDDSAGGVGCDGANPGLAGSICQVVAGGEYSCVLDVAGSIDCWGRGDTVANSPPSGNFVKLEPGFRHACALDVNGRLACWGSDHPAVDDPGPYVDIQSGPHSTCAWEAGGTVTKYSNHGAECRNANLYIDQGIGKFHSCGVLPNGSLDCWGAMPSSDPIPSGTFTEVEAGFHHSCALRSDGTITCWGQATNGASTGMLNAPSGVWSSLLGGAYHTCATDAFGAVTCWGCNSEADCPESRQGPYRLLSTKGHHNCAFVGTTDAVECWGGNNNWNQLDVPAAYTP